MIRKHHCPQCDKDWQCRAERAFAECVYPQDFLCTLCARNPK